MKYYFLFCLILMISCGNPLPDTKTEEKTQNTDKENTEMFKSKVIIILSKELNGDSNTINIQDYIQDGVSYIPVFTSLEKFTESTGGADIGKQKIEIDGLLLLSILSGNETLRVNPGLKDEEYLKAADLIAKYKNEIEEKRQEINKLRNK